MLTRPFANPAARKASPAGAPTFDQLVQQRNDRARQECLSAAERIAAGVMPRCKWAGSHRYQVIREENGMVVECCMDCGGRPRTYPVGKTSKDAKPYGGAI